ncbi:MAG: DUF5683 domain-containing protein [Bacteroidota bacterium]|jgi:hypothetical protein
MVIQKFVILLIPILLIGQILQAQNSGQPAADSSVQKTAVKDSVKKHDPRIATRRSAILPGWGQAYNKQYWKIPLAYGIIAIPVGTYIFNNNTYKKLKFAYEARYKQAQGDPSDVPFIDPELTGLSIDNLINYRNAYRRDRDYSVLFFLLAWGFQVVDATVFAHLKEFDVSNNLSMQLRPRLDPISRNAGLSLTFQLRSKSGKSREAR